MNLFDIKSFPYQAFGEGASMREVRLVVSPQTTGEERLSIVHTTVPPLCMSQGHAHEGFDEYIYFDIGGEAVIDGDRLTVPPMGLVHARAGMVHECVNTSGNRTLTLFCVFVPPLQPYGPYPELIEKTNAYLFEKKRPDLQP